MVGIVDFELDGFTKMKKIASWEHSLIPLTSTLAEAVQNLDDTCLQIALVVSPEGVLVGTLTDGDIRRGLLRGLSMDMLVDEVISREPFVAPKNLAREMILQLMQVNKVHQLPVVDEKRRVVGLHLWSQLISPSQRSNKMVIMAGGEGSRLRPQTASCPKPLLKVGGKPILEHIIERSKAEGFRDFVLAIHYLGHMIEDHFGDGSAWDVKIQYLHEKIPLGTAGALNLISPRPKTPIVISNGDVLTDIRYSDLLDFHDKHNATATMAVRLYEWHHPFGVVHTDGMDIKSLEEKPILRNHINAGIYVLNPDAFDALTRNKYTDMPTLFDRLREKDSRTIVYPIHEPWLDVGSEKDLRLANKNHPPRI
jgi:dTDP-glucose pyrophosphorylase